MREKIVLGSAAAVILLVVFAQYSGSSTNDPIEVGSISGAINITLLNNAGVMIEVGEARIYIDPFDIPDSYQEYPADAILITHDHGDHYQAPTINMLQKDGTLNVFPEVMTSAIRTHDGIGVNPLEEFMIGEITVTPFYMYTFAISPEIPGSHPRDSNFTSYIIDIGGFRIFHAGDTKNLPEYEQIAGTIDVALLPLGPGCQSMADQEVVDAIRDIDPAYFIPIHWQASAKRTFMSRYRSSITTSTECEICDMDYFTTQTFESG